MSAAREAAARINADRIGANDDAAARKHIALVGFMAAGKTTIGFALAEKLGLAFADSDAVLVARHGPIHELFASLGEGGFRELEYEIVRELLAAPQRVLALGGGAVTYAATSALLAERAVRVYLEAPLDTLLGRLRRSPTVRPLLGAVPTRARVRALLAEREPLYRQAELIVNAGGRPHVAVAHDIAERLVRQAPRRPDAPHSRVTRLE